MTIPTRREPSFHGVDTAPSNGTHGSAHAGAHHGGHAGGVAAPTPAVGRVNGFGRFISTVQIVATLLAVPLGLASGYSIYRANFSVETTCQNLRGNIIGMLDKNVDATTRRMLVRRDVESFEQNCGAVDPDAHAAFKALLAREKPAAHVTVVAKTDAAATPAQAARIPAPKPTPKPAPQVASTSGSKADSQPELEPEPDMTDRAASLSDARWLAGVRQALVTHAQTTPDLAAAPERPVAAAPATLAAQAQTLAAGQSPRVVLPSSWPVPAQTQTQTQTQGQVAAPQMQLVPQTANADHPVPPAPIPVIAPVPGPGTTAREERASPLGAFIARLPLIGRVIEPAGN
ncbi:MAG: hypothetical protein K9G60_07465 [Pseudolabrys sp.]|nr:hypothetical protein [Pseudolabrys sp.]